MPVKTPVYLLSAALVGSLGLNAVQLGAIGEVRAGVVDNKPLETRVSKLKSEIAGATVLQVVQYGCDSIDAAYGLTGANRCVLSDMKKFCVLLDHNEDPDMGDVDFWTKPKGGTWTAGEPE